LHFDEYLNAYGLYIIYWIFIFEKAMNDLHGISIDAVCTADSAQLQYPHCSNW
jgi:hypothetical protein